MKLGVCVPNYGETCSPEALQRVAEAAEETGYDSLWCTDHILLPKGSNTPYERILESITTLSFLAASTRRVRLGISSLITPMRNPVVAAKELATVDVLSGGRAILATSAGWNEGEFQNLGSDFHTRGRRLDASIRLIRRVWSGNVDFESKVIPQRFHDAAFEPPPIQKHLTIWIGGTSIAAMRRAVRLGDGWHPNVEPLDQFSKLVQDFKGIPEAAGKQISARIGVNVKADRSEYLSARGQRRIILSSNMEQNRKIVADLGRLGVSYLVLVPSIDGKASVADQIESLTKIGAEFL